MKKSYNVDSTYNNMRIDRWVRNNIANLPQAFIEKSLRNGNHQEEQKTMLQLKREKE